MVAGDLDPLSHGQATNVRQMCVLLVAQEPQAIARHVEVTIGNKQQALPSSP